MKQQNHEETIMKAFVWSLYSNGEPLEEAKQIATKNVNRFKKTEGDEIREKEGHNDPIGIYVLAKHVAEKYLTSLDGFVKEAESKKTLRDLDKWWQKHQLRASMNLSEHNFNELAIKIMPSLRSKLEGEGDAVCVIPPEDEQAQASGCTDLVVSIDPKGLSVSDNFPKYAEMWRAEMRKADFIPQAEGDLKIIRDNEKKCKDVEGKIDITLQNISEYLEKALQGDPEVKRYTDELISLRKKMQALKEETAAHRKNIAHAPKRYMDDQKKQAVTEHLARVRDAADKLFVGAITKGRNDADAKVRLVASYKGKRTVDTVKQAVEEEADKIIDEMNDMAALCRSNLNMIEMSGRPALFQDKEALMTWEPERLEQEIKLRVQQEELLKAKAQRNPDKLAEWKDTVDDIDNVPKLDNWYKAHWGEVKESLPHEEDQAELLKHCGERKQKLKAEYATSINNPPPHEDPPQGPDGKKGRQKESAPSEAEHQETEEEPEEINLILKFTVFGTVKQAKEIATEVYNLIGENPLLQGEITFRRIRK